MKQSNPRQSDAVAASSEVRRVYTASLVQIGQRWQRKCDGLVLRIYQVHRSDRRVDLLDPEHEGPPTGKDLVPVKFPKLRHEWRLLTPNKIGGQG